MGNQYFINKMKYLNFISLTILIEMICLLYQSEKQ